MVVDPSPLLGLDEWEPAIDTAKFTCFVRNRRRHASTIGFRSLGGLDGLSGRDRRVRVAGTRRAPWREEVRLAAGADLAVGDRRAEEPLERPEPEPVVAHFGPELVLEGPGE